MIIGNSAKVRALKMTDHRKITEVQNCRLCGKPGLQEVFDFGMMDLPKWPRSKSGGVKAPLKLMACSACGLGQLAHSIDQESLFREYWYRTGMNGTMREHMANLAKAVSQEISIKDEDLVVEVGANDGTLLKNFKKGRLIGFEPSDLCPKEIKSGVHWVNDFFDAKLLPKAKHGTVKALLSIAMFYYLDKPEDFAAMVEKLLAPDGIWVCEMAYALDLLDRVSFDFINHEHVTIWSAEQFNQVIKKAGLEIFRIERNDLNGGSIRFWVGRPGQRPVEPSVAKTIRQEEGRLSETAWQQLAKKIKKVSKALRELVIELRAEGKTVMVYGASTRGLTTLGASGLDAEEITAAVEIIPQKFGRFYGTTGIRIISEAEMRSVPPDALLILPYSFITEFVRREKAFLDGGGVFIVPMPVPKIISKASKEAI